MIRLYYMYYNFLFCWTISMDTKHLAPPKSVFFHPSTFENNLPVPEDDNILASAEARWKGQSTNESEIGTHSQSGKYNLNQNEDSLTDSNTRHLFKNLYGETPLTFLFFSDKNIENIQNLIRMVVYREMGKVIDKQSYTELMIVMRSIFLEYSAHPPLININTSESEKVILLDKYRMEVYRLNDIVVNAVVPRVISQLQQYLDYIRDSSQQPYQAESPKNDSVSGQRQYRSITQVLIGGEL